jgi:hypothetical protein
MSVKTKVFHQKVRFAREKHHSAIWLSLLCVCIWVLVISGVCELFSVRPVSIKIAEASETIEIEVSAPVEIEEVSGDVDSILKRVGEKNGVDWKLLKAVCMTESRCNMNLDCSIQEGACDGWQSYGAFQIHLPSHPDISAEQANDFEWAAEWTAKHGMRYKDNPGLFFKAHNGIGKTTNQWYIDRAMGFYTSI